MKGRTLTATNFERICVRRDGFIRRVCTTTKLSLENCSVYKGPVHHDSFVFSSTENNLETRPGKNRKGESLISRGAFRNSADRFNL